MRCEGWHRHGGALTLGIPEWVQCEKDAVVMVTFVRDGKEETLPACVECHIRLLNTEDCDSAVVKKSELIKDESQANT